MTVVGPLLPHALHLGAARLEVAKVLLAQAGLLVDLDVVPGEGRGLLLVGGQGGEDAFCGLACAAVGRGEEVEGVVGTEEGTEAATGLVGLGPAILGEFDSVIGDALVDFTVLCKGRGTSVRCQDATLVYTTSSDVLLPSDWACRMRMMRRGFAMVGKQRV